MIEFLLLEDDPQEAKIVKEILTPHQVKHVTNLEQISDICQEEDYFFDYAILDLSVPKSSNEPSPSEDNGIEAFRLFRKSFPGTPILILTGSSSTDHFREMIGQSFSTRVWGKTEIKTVDYFRKNKLDELYGVIDMIVSEINRVNDIELYTNHPSYSIGTENKKNKRVFSIIANKMNGFKVNVNPIGPGYSGAKIHLLDIQNENNKTLSKIIVKTGDLDKIEEESHNYENHVVGRLDHSKYPPRIDVSSFGAKNLNSIYYKFLESEKNMSLFDYVASDSFESEKLRLCFDLTSEWRDLSKNELKQISDIRSIFLSDNTLLSLVNSFNLSWVTQFERRRVNFNMCISHCDFHGGNVFINPTDNTRHIIDYGDIKISPIAFDAICLELGFFFNKDSKVSGWFMNDSIYSWANDEIFFSNEKLSKLKVIRDWARENINEKEFLATAYCYVIRQLKFPDVQKNKLKETLAILDSIQNEFNKQ